VLLGLLAVFLHAGWNVLGKTVADRLLAFASIVLITSLRAS
jgi:hypothetical protein